MTNPVVTKNKNKSKQNHTKSQDSWVAQCKKCDCSSNQHTELANYSTERNTEDAKINKYDAKGNVIGKAGNSFSCPVH